MGNPEPDLNQLSSEVASLRRALKVISALMWLAPLKLLWFLAFRVPKFEQIFNDMLVGQALPTSTQIVINAGSFIGGNAHWLLLLFVAAFTTFLVFTIKTRRSLWYFYVGLAFLFSSWAFLVFSKYGLWFALSKLVTGMQDQFWALQGFSWQLSNGKRSNFAQKNMIR
ncbi:MAG: hypothetical protein ACI8UO_005289, partial [Verrucomicrobiales bacterium]